MPRFFVDSIPTQELFITGDDARHISRSLRMREGERLTVCDGCGIDAQCEIISLDEQQVKLHVIERQRSESEPDIRLTIYQGYPKGDKLETIIEKAVELGVHQIVPVLTERSVARPDAKAAAKKLERWQRHALEAAKQCGRGIIPQVSGLVDFSHLPELMSQHGLAIFCYELGGSPLREMVSHAQANDIAIFIGPEGGISPVEAEALAAAGCRAATLGKRILRCETAPIAAAAAVMALTGNLE